MNIVAVTLFFLCLSGVLFPFTVAATNVGLGVVLGLGIVSGLWWQGARICWQRYRLLTLALCIYMAMVPLGLIWSLDVKWGLHIMGRHWFWLLLPVVVALLADEKRRQLFLTSLSIGLGLNLGYCVLQKFGIVEVTTLGSTAADATGHIGHIGFGLVYGIWAAWLLHLGLIRNDKWRLIAWGFAIWSSTMVFLAQGRSGYLVALVLMLCVFIKWVFESGSWRSALPATGVLLVIMVVVALGPGKERLHGTWIGLTQPQQTVRTDLYDSFDNAVLATQIRFRMWRTSLVIWQQYPVLGVGTGGLPKAVAELQKSGLSSSAYTFAHPHNQYLHNLIRWGPAGVVALVALLLVWMREGLRHDWQNSVTVPLVTLPALALAIHGLSSSGMEEHFSAILAVLLLGTALSDGRLGAKEAVQ